MDDPGAALERLNGLLREGMVQHLAFQVVQGAIAEDVAWREQARRNRASELLTLAPADWPDLDVVWDLQPESFHLSLDHTSSEEFARLFDSIGIFTVGIHELQDSLLPGSQRVADPFSSMYRHKTANLVAHLEAGGSVTPPLVRHLTEGLCLAGGNHRFGLARHRLQSAIPILMPLAEATSVRPKLKTLSGRC